MKPRTAPGMFWRVRVENWIKQIWPYTQYLGDISFIDLVVVSIMKDNKDNDEDDGHF